MSPVPGKTGRRIRPRADVVPRVRRPGSPDHRAAAAPTAPAPAYAASASASTASGVGAGFELEGLDLLVAHVEVGKAAPSFRIGVEVLE